MRRLALSLLLLLVLAAAWVLRPLPQLTTPPLQLASSREEAVSRLDALRARDALALHPGCETIAFLPTARASRCILLLHGITNCPLQFLEFAQRLAAHGDAVLVPRVDHHGLADRMTTDLANLDAREVMALVTECVGIASGLGDTVIVVGLSTSAVAAAWAASALPAVDRAVVIAPALAPPWRPRWIVPLLTRAALRLPNAFVWWDDELRENLDGPSQCYPRFSTRAIAQSYRMGEAVMRGLRDPGTKRAAPDLVVVISEADEAIDNDRAEALAIGWPGARPDRRVRVVTFPERLHVVHDMIDPAQVGARTDLVYPILLPLVEGGTPPVGAPVEVHDAEPPPAAAAARR